MYSTVNVFVFLFCTLQGSFVQGGQAPSRGVLWEIAATPIVGNHGFTYHTRSSCVLQDHHHAVIHINISI